MRLRASVALEGTASVPAGAVNAPAAVTGAPVHALANAMAAPCAAVQLPLSAVVTPADCAAAYMSEPGAVWCDSIRATIYVSPLVAAESMLYATGHLGHGLMSATL